jgi:ubiquinone biosynthesis protein Coq4
MVEVSKADYEYFNGTIRNLTTESSVLISSSPYLNSPQLRALIAQEMLRRNGPDVPNTAFIPEVAQILHQLEDLPTILGLFEEEKTRLPAFKTWLERRRVSDFKAHEVEHCKPGTLGFIIHDFLANSGYSNDFFFQGMIVDSDFTFYLKERAYTHDIEHIITGFEPNHAGEIALLAANSRSYYRYFRPELASFFNRVPAYLKAKTLLKDTLYYPQAAAVHYEAEDIGAAQGRCWKMPLMLAPWRDLIDTSVEEIRQEYGIVDPPPPGHWAWTTAVSEDPRYSAAAPPPTAAAAE